IRLEMAECAAATLSTVLSLDNDVAALASVAMTPLNDRTPDHDSAADTGAESEHHQAVGISARTGPVFTVCCRIAVVLKHNPFFELIGEQLAYRQVVPAWKIGRLEQHALVDIHGTWRAKSHGGDPFPADSGG